MSVTLSSLRTQVLQRSDMVIGFISVAELNSYINASLAELYDLLTSRFEDYYTVPFQFTIAAGDDGYDLSTVVPAFYKLRGVDRAISGPADWGTVRPFQFVERNKYQNRLNVYQRAGRALLQYRLVGNRLSFLPKDQAPATYQLWYVPAFVPLVNDGDTTSDLQSWHEYVIVDAAIKCMQKEESDVSVLVMQKEQLKQRIEAMAAGRDAGQQDRVGDVTSYGLSITEDES